MHASLARIARPAALALARPANPARPFPVLSLPQLSFARHSSNMSSSTQLLTVRTLSKTFSGACKLTHTRPQSILDANETYAEAFARSDPALLQKLAKGQSPRIFWLGCSDSRVSAEL